MTAVITITREDLARVFPRPKSGERRIIWDRYAEALCSSAGAGLLERFEVTTNLRHWQHFAATIGVETGGLTVLWESGAYTAAGLLRVFGAGRHSAGITPGEAKRLAGKGPQIFERVYGLGNPRKAKELGNVEPGDGWRFRGLGFNQMTGRHMHTKAAQTIGVSLDALTDPVNLLHAALIEWKAKGCNAHAARDDVIAVRKLINAGSLKVPERNLNGVPQARAYLGAAKAVWPENGPLFAANSDLAIGARGARVEDLQHELAESGFPCGEADGTFGQLTERALAAFQVAYGLPGTGRADDKTWEALRAAGPAAPVRDLTAKDLAARGSRTIKLWSRVVSLGRWVYTAAFGTAAAEAAGIDVVEGAVSSAERVGSVVERIAPEGDFGPRTWLMVGIVALGAIGWMLTKWGKTGTDARVEDANAAIHVG